MTTSTPPRAIHLAAGMGTRLRPLTDDRPKPLVELAGTSLLERNVDTLDRAGVDDQLVVTGYRADQIRKLGYETVHNPVYDETDMVYSLFRAEDRFPADRDLLVSYGDIVYERDVVDALLDADAPVNVVVDREWESLWTRRFDDPLDDAETLRLDADGAICEIGGRPESTEEIDAQYVGLVTIRSDVVGPFAEKYHELAGGDGESVSVEMTHFLQSLVEDGWDVRAVAVDGGWLEVDTTSDLELYRALLADGSLSPILDRTF